MSLVYFSVSVFKAKTTINLLIRNDTKKNTTSLPKDSDCASSCLLVPKYLQNVSYPYSFSWHCVKYQYLVHFTFTLKIKEKSHNCLVNFQKWNRRRRARNVFVCPLFCNLHTVTVVVVFKWWQVMLSEEFAFPVTVVDFTEIDTNWRAYQADEMKQTPLTTTFTPRFSLWIKSRGSDLAFFMPFCRNYWSFVTAFDNAITTWQSKPVECEKRTSFDWNEQRGSRWVIGWEINQAPHPVCFDL